MRVIDADVAQYIADKELSVDEAGAVQFVLAHTPTIDAAPIIHGKWKLHKNGNGTCNVCNFTPLYVWDFDRSMNFCQHCGADHARLQLQGG